MTKARFILIAIAAGALFLFARNSAATDKYEASAIREMESYCKLSKGDAFWACHDAWLAGAKFARHYHDQVNGVK